MDEDYWPDRKDILDTAFSLYSDKFNAPASGFRKQLLTDIVSLEFDELGGAVHDAIIEYTVYRNTNDDNRLSRDERWMFSYYKILYALSDCIEGYNRNICRITIKDNADYMISIARSDEEESVGGLDHIKKNIDDYISLYEELMQSLERSPKEPAVWNRFNNDVLAGRHEEAYESADNLVRNDKLSSDMNLRKPESENYRKFMEYCAKRYHNKPAKKKRSRKRKSPEKEEITFNIMEALNKRFNIIEENKLNDLLIDAYKKKD